MVKRILKIVGIVLGIFIGLSGGAVGIAFASGAFNKEVIDITKIYLDENDTTSTNKTIYTLDDVVQNIKFLPNDATETDLKITVSGNDNGVIEDLPSTITAGKDFTIKVKKDEKGNNIGGVVTIRAVSSSGLADVTLRVVVDVNIPDNSLFFSGNSSGKISTTGKSFTMPISQSTQYVYLKSGLVNAFSLPVGNNENLKSADISYTYYRSNGTLYDEQNLSQELAVESIYNAEEGRYNYYYKIPVTTDIAGTIDIEAKMHRTYEIQKAFEDGKFGTLVGLIETAINTGSETARIQASAILLNYNNFLDTYMKYFDTTEESYAFFKNCIPSGSVAFGINDLANIKKSMEFVFVTCSATINVTAIKLDDFTSLANPKEYDVFDDSLIYSLSGTDALNIIEQFSLKVTTDNETAGGIEQEKAYLFESLKVKPYLYLASDNLTDENFSIVDDKEVVTWSGRNYSYIKVYSFDDQTPITTPSLNSTEIVGYLLNLTNTDEYLYVTEITLNGERHWKITCNTPLPNNQSDEMYKALYLGFEVSGIAEDNSVTSIESYTRIYINYEDYDFSSSSVNNLAFETVDTQMTINTNVNNSGSLTSGLYTQDISLNITDENIDNIDTVSYTSVMYFVESSSNAVEGGSKVATLGKYSFVNFINSNKSDASSYYYMLNDETELIGERIPTYRNVRVLDSNGNAVKDAKGSDVYTKQYYLHALNASKDPVKIFAVVYLSDSSGNPIDINGRKISVNESDQTDGSVPSLVVIRITDYQETVMPQITINSYVDVVNFYTESLIPSTVGGIDFNAGYLNRNSINSYVDGDGKAVEATALSEIQDYLRLKLLKDNYFTIYLTTFELSNSGSIVTEDNSTKELVIKDVFGKEVTKAYVINTMNNKQIAFNNICNDFDYYDLYVGGTGVDILPSETKIMGDGTDGAFTKDSNATMIKFVLHATETAITSNGSSGNVNNTIIYLDPTKSTIPYSNLLLPSSNQSTSSIRNNWTNYETNKLEINNLELDDVDMYTRLYARYAGDGASSGELEFRIPKLIGDSLSRTDYVLTLDDGNIKYTTETNLMNGSDYNLSLVDCSQAGSRTDIPTGSSTGSYYYTTISDYIDHYVVGTNGTQVTYTNPDNVMSFAETYVFNNVDQEGNYTDEIYFGTKTYAINMIENTVEINGYTLDLTAINVDGINTEYRLTINQGEYFPIVQGAYALIYNELFTIYNSASDNSSKYILDYVDSNDSGTHILVSTTANLILASGETDKVYNPDTYLDDSSTDVKNSAITVNSDGTQAKINFKQGEEIGSFQEDSNGKYKQVTNGTKVSYEEIIESDYNGTRYSVKPVYEQDNNGNLYFNESTQSYEVISSGVSVAPEQRYSKKGVVVYLLVSFNLIKTSDDSSEYTFYKAIAYELVQEEIEIVGVNKIVDGENDVNSDSNRLEVEAGKTTTIYLNMAQNASDAKIITKANDERYFFNHVKFEKGSTAINGITLEEKYGSDGNKESIKLTVPSLVKNDSLTLLMTYKYKGTEVTSKFYIKLVANVSFEPTTSEGVSITNKNVIIGNDTYNVYAISLADGTYEITKNLIPTFFDADIGSSKLITSVDLTTTNSYTKLCSINTADNSITLQPTYAEYSDGSITRDFVLCDIVLNLSDGSTITLNTKLYIEIIPTYVVDLTQLDSNVTIFNNEDLFANYIRLFSNEITLNTITDTNNILNNADNKYNMFTITATGENKDLVTISGGKIKLNYIPSVDTTVTLSVSYTEAGTTITKAFSVIIRGVTLNTTELGQSCKDENTDTTTLDSNLNVTLSANETFDLDNYLTFDLTCNIDSDTENNSSYDVQAYLVDANGNMIADENIVAGTYRIAYAKNSGGAGTGMTIVEITDYTMTITIESSQESTEVTE